MEPLKNISLDALKNVTLSCLFCFITGFLYSLGVFSPSVEAAATPSGSLDGVWSAGMALLSAFSIPAMFFSGVYLCHDLDITDHGTGITKSVRGRLLTAAGSLSFALLAVGGYGVAINSPFLIRLSFISAGVGFGLIFLHTMELLAVWVPHRPGLAVGIGQLTYGLGSIASSSIFKYLLENYSTPNSLYITAAIMSIPTAAATPFIQWPHPLSETSDSNSESQPLLKQPSLSLKRLSRLPSFWMYAFTIFCLRAGMAFVAYYFKIGKTFGKDISEVVTSFQAATIAGTLSRPLTGALVDILKTEAGFFSLGSKNVILILLFAQAVSFLALVPISSQSSYIGFAFFAGIIQTIFAAGTCCVPLLAREQFGAANSSVVFGTGGSLAGGLGEIAAVWMMAIVEKSSVNPDRPRGYEAYYFISFVWSVCGLVTCLLLKAERTEHDSRSESVERSEGSL